MRVVEIVRPLIAANPELWSGLPDLGSTEFEAAFGAPESSEEADLGYRCAQRQLYESANGAFTLWTRGGQAVLVEVQGDWPADILAPLGTPCAILPQEIRVPGAYAHEWLFCSRGLAATVAEAFADGSERVLRLRGFKPIRDPSGFGTDLYRAAESRTRWSAP